MARIAVVDDDLDFQQLMRDVLHEFGWTAIPCTTMLAAYTALRTAPPDVVLLDIRMEQTHGGWDVLTYLHMHPTLCHVAVIICSAMTDEVTAKREWLAAHDVGVLLKPFDLDDAEQMINHRLAVAASRLVCAV